MALVCLKGIAARFFFAFLGCDEVHGRVCGARWRVAQWEEKAARVTVADADALFVDQPGWGQPEDAEILPLGGAG